MGNIDIYDLFYRNYTNYTDIKHTENDCLKEKKGTSTDIKRAVIDHLKEKKDASHRYKICCKKVFI
jgi:hypothetical protein